MAEIVDSLPTWSPTAVKAYQEGLTRHYVARSVWHKIDVALNFKYGPIGLLIFLCGTAATLLFWPAARPLAEDLSLGLACVATVTVFLIVPMIDRWKARQPRWVTCSIAELIDLRDIELPPYHPLRRAITDARMAHHDAEFEAEYLELAEGGQRGHSEIVTIWMYPDPFTSTVREPILVLKDWDTVVNPS